MLDNYGLAGRYAICHDCYVQLSVPNNKLNNSLEPACKCEHNTETALDWVKHYIMMSINQGKPKVLLLLHISATCAKVDQNTFFLG